MARTRFFVVNEEGVVNGSTLTKAADRSNASELRLEAGQLALVIEEKRGAKKLNDQQQRSPPHWARCAAATAVATLSL